MEFAKNLRKIRQERKLSLQELADLSGVSKAMLSKIEREEKNPTLQIAAQISQGLGLSLSSMLEVRKKERVVLIRASQRIVFRDEATGFERLLLSPTFPTLGVEFILNRIPQDSPGVEFPPHLAGVREFVTVAQGRLQITLNNEAVTLEEGDSIFFYADVQHRFTNVGPSECSYYLVIDSCRAESPPS